jgi:AGZA family xanthine/uracil permease-like MFS transporter
MNFSFLKTEILAGITTFFTMAYIVIVNPMILQAAGMDHDAVFTATCLSAALGCFLMGILANYPIALAPSMSLNAYFSFYVVQQLHFSWQAALGIVLLSSLIFAALTITQLRQWLIYSMPNSLKMAIAAGIGLFLVVIAFKTLHIQWNPNTWINEKTLLCFTGVLTVFILDRLRIMGSILITMIIVTLVGAWFQPTHLDKIFSLPPSISSTFFQLKMPSMNIDSGIIILIFVFVTLFDNTGTLIGVLHESKLLPKNKSDGKAKRLSRALFADSLASLIGALLGTSTTGSYIESAAGVRAGGKTGLTAVIVGVLFLLLLFCAPLASIIPNYAAAIALIYVGFLMTKNLLGITWNEPSEFIPALICVSSIPLTFSIANGVAAGFVAYVLIKLIAGKKTELKKSLWLVAVICGAYLIAH